MTTSKKTRKPQITSCAVKKIDILVLWVLFLPGAALLMGLLALLQPEHKVSILTQEYHFILLGSVSFLILLLLHFGLKSIYKRLQLKEKRQATRQRLKEKGCIFESLPSKKQIPEEKLAWLERFEANPFSK